MLKSILCTTLLLHTLCSGMNDPSFRATFFMKTGILLRLHVVAQDDTDAMQSLKLQVRDSIQTAYAAQNREPADTMLIHSEKILPILSEAAYSTAEAYEYDQPVSVLLGWFDFGDYKSNGLFIPAGRYPALIVHLGEAKGHNWWGLLDPAAALESAAFESSDAWQFDWSWDAFFFALRHFPLIEQISISSS